MKFLRLLILALTVGIVFSSCQKELTAETGTATGTLVKDAAGDCTALVSGAYKKDTILNASNYVDIQVNITEIGTYTITSDTINGYYFRAEGAVALTGLNSIRLIGIGKPIAVGTDVFTIKFSGTSCDVNINVTGNTGGGTTAVFTLGSTAGACTGFTLGAGTYTPGTALGATNTVTLNVNVVTPGTYTLTASTTAATGVIFTGTGNLPSTGNATITLTAQPAAGNITNFPINTIAIPNASYSVSAGGTTCNFLVGFNAPLAPAVYVINCATAATQTGIFQAGTALTIASKITISVSPSTTGSYTITTDTLNGVSYIGIGNFSTTFTQNVDLYANPINSLPAAAGSFVHRTHGGTVNCNNLTVTYTASGGGGNITGFIKAKIGSTSAPFTTFNTAIHTTTGVNTSTIDFGGDNDATGNEFLEIVLNSTLTGFSINTDYNINMNTNSFTVQCFYATPTGIPFYAHTNATNPFTIRFSALASNHLAGTFSGNIDDGNGIPINLYSGSFDLNF
jgi:hypothetical protein